MKRCTIGCPECQTAVEVRVFFNRFGVFRCHRCGVFGLGNIRLQDDDEDENDGE